MFKNDFVFLLGACNEFSVNIWIVYVNFLQYFCVGQCLYMLYCYDLFNILLSFECILDPWNL